MNNELQTKPDLPVVNKEITPMDMLQIAVEKGADMDKLEKLMELNERWEANKARKAFVKAMGVFKEDPPDLIKNKTVDYSTNKGRTLYDHATLDQCSTVIGKSLSKVGISHRWKTEQLGDGVIKVSCILTHEDGHLEETTLQSTADQSGGKNSIQAIMSTVSYLERYTLLAATGMSTRDQDDDGNGIGGTQTITPEQKQELIDLIEKNEVDLIDFLKYGEVESLDQIKSEHFAGAKSILMKRGVK